VPGTQLGVGFDVVAPGEGGEPSSPWCNHKKCEGRPGMDGQALCNEAKLFFHCLTWAGECRSEKCYITKY